MQNGVEKECLVMLWSWLVVPQTAAQVSSLQQIMHAIGGKRCMQKCGVAARMLGDAVVFAGGAANGRTGVVTTTIVHAKLWEEICMQKCGR